MADEQIEILIKAVDEATATLKNIEDSVKNTADTSSEANEKLGNSFTRVQGAMLNLGQIAQGVHNIFEIQKNTTRLLENAQDRLENATIRLQQANQSLADAEQKVNDIEKNHARDSLTLEGAQISLEEAQNNYNDTLEKYGATALETRKAYLDVERAQADLTDAQNLGTDKAKELTKAQEDLTNKQDAVTIASNNVDRAQRQLEKTTEDAKWAYLDMGMQVISTVGNLGTFIKTMETAQVVSKSMVGIEGLGGVTAFLTGPWGMAIGIAAAALGGLLLTQQNSKTSTDTFVTNENGAIKVINDLEASANRTDQAIGNMLAQQEALTKIQSTYGVNTGTSTSMSNGPALSSSMKTQVADVLYNISTPKSIIQGGDFILRPNGDMIQSDPNDTIFASKSGIGKGIIVNVTGPIYGVSASQISRALSDELNNKLSI
jgi:hypothetical protein